MPDSGWSRGYYPNALYTCGFHREMAPNWLDFASLLKGHRPNRVEGQPFRYLELGSGMGFHLPLLAAAYPEGRFVGVDFHADQIAHSRQLADQLALSNVVFLHGDLVELAFNRADGGGGISAELTPGFDYVTAHGVFTWVSQEVRDALLTLTSRLLGIGGVFYCSYNTLPGWYAASIYQHLAEYERSHGDPRDALGVYRRTAELLADLTDPEAGHTTVLGKAYPALAGTVREALSADPHYLLHEYANAGWEPLYVDRVHAQMSLHQLRFIGSATLPEAFPNLLPKKLQEVARADQPSGPEELLLDIATNKRFRRDLFVHGFRPLSNQDLQERIGATWIVSISPEPMPEARFSTTFGEVRSDDEALRSVFRRLSRGPASIAALAEELRVGVYDAATMVALLLHADRVGLQRPPEGAASTSQRVNHSLVSLIASGAPYQFLVAPVTGTGVYTPLIFALLWQARALGEVPSQQVRHLLEGLQKLGQTLRPPAEGADPAQPRADEPDQEALARAAVERFNKEDVTKLALCGAAPEGVQIDAS